MKRFDVISIGSATIDVFLKSDDFKIVKNKGFSSGVGLCQSYGSKVEVDEMFLSSGGGATNTSVAFSRLGLKVATICRLGNDLFGKMIVSELKKEDVDTSFLIQKDNEATDYSTVLLAKDGSRTILIYRGKTGLITKDIPFDKLEAKWIYLSSLEGNLKIVEKILKMRKNFSGIAFNPGSRELSQRLTLKSFLRFIDVLIWNKEEAQKFLGERLGEKKFWKEIGYLGPKIVVVTDGRNGAYLYNRYDNHNRHLFSPAFKNKPIDQTGAGDAFGSAFVAGIIKGFSIEKSFSLGSANGASVVTEVGAKTALLRDSEIDSWLKKAPKIRK